MDIRPGSGKARLMSGIDDSELSAWELEALQKAEAKFMRQRGETNRFSVLSVVGEEEVRGTWFTAYDNSAGDERVDEVYRHSPIVLYSEKNRFPYLCDQYMRTWSESCDEFLECMIALERGDGGFETELQAKSFGVDVADDCYIVTFSHAAIAPIFATRELLFKFVRFAVKSQAQVGGWPQDMQGRLSDLLQEWEGLVEAKDAEIAKRPRISDPK